jgi:hypothetical protein
MRVTLDAEDSRLAPVQRCQHPRGAVQAHATERAWVGAA